MAQDRRFLSACPRRRGACCRTPISGALKNSARGEFDIQPQPLCSGARRVSLDGRHCTAWRERNDHRMAVDGLSRFRIQKRRDIGQRNRFIDKSLTDPAREDEGKGAAGHFLVVYHMFDQRLA